MADEVVRLGIDPCRIVVTPSTVDTELFNPEINGTDARRRYSLDGRFVVGWTGSFRSFHGLDLLLDVKCEERVQVPSDRQALASTLHRLRKKIGSNRLLCVKHRGYMLLGHVRFIGSPAGQE